MRRFLAVTAAMVMAVFMSAASVSAALGPDSEGASWQAWTGSTSAISLTGADWRQFRGGAAHRGVNSYETELSRASVSGLHLQWVANRGFNSSPSVADGVVYISSAGLEAYPADCGTGGAVCSPLWVGHPENSNWSSPAIARGVVYITGSNGVSAYAVGCRSDGGQCPRLWRDPNVDAGFSSPTVAGGMVYVVTNGGQLNAYDASACRAAGGSCSPTWKASLNGFVQSSPAVADGMVYVGTGDGYLNAYKVGCGTGGATCNPVWRGNIHGDTVSSPAVGGGVVYMASYQGVLYAFPTACRNTGADCEPLWKAVLPPIIHSSPAATDTTVYIAAHRRLYAFAVGCGSGGALCTPLWKSGRITDEDSTLASSPAVANGVVYIGTQNFSTTDGRLVAFPAECGKGGAVCGRLWRSALTGGIVNSSPAVSHGMVYVASNSGRLYAFGLD